MLGVVRALIARSGSRNKFDKEWISTGPLYELEAHVDALPQDPETWDPPFRGGPSRQIQCRSEQSFRTSADKVNVKRPAKLLVALVADPIMQNLQGAERPQRLQEPVLAFPRIRLE